MNDKRDLTEEEMKNVVELVDDRTKKENEDMNKKMENEEKIKKFIERGNKLIYPQMQDKWKDCVEKAVNGMYHGMEIDAALEIMEKLEEGINVEDLEAVLDAQDHSTNSYHLLRGIVFDFSKRGPEFVEKSPYQKYMSVPSGASAEIAKKKAENKRYEEELREKDKDDRNDKDDKNNQNKTGGKKVEDAVKEEKNEDKDIKTTEKKILASNNSKAKEMLEAIAINKQTENLRKNKLSMLDRAKEARSKAYLTLERVTNKAKEVLVNNKLIKGAIAGFKNAVRITKKSLKYAGIITIAGGALYIGTTYAPTHGVDQPEVGEGPGITEKAEDMQIETSQDIEIKKDGDGYKIVHNGMNDPGGKYVKTDKNGNKYKVDAIEAGQEHNQKEIADYTGEEEVNITDTSNASATKESQERQNQDEQSGKKTTVHEKNETTTNYEKGMEKDNKGAQQQANGQTRNENDTSKDVKVEEQKQENLTSQEKQGNNVSTNTSSTQSKNEIDDFSDDLDDIIKAYENQQKEK